MANVLKKEGQHSQSKLSSQRLNEKLMKGFGNAAPYFCCLVTRG